MSDHALDPRGAFVLLPIGEFEELRRKAESAAPKPSHSPISELEIMRRLSQWPKAQREYANRQANGRAS